jgi:hypothetical protein
MYTWIKGTWSLVHTKRTIDDAREVLQGLGADLDQFRVGESQESAEELVGFDGLVVWQRKEFAGGRVEYALYADPCVAIWNKGTPCDSPQENHGGFEVEGLLVALLSAIRRKYPFLFVLTNDTPRSSDSRSHLNVASPYLERVVTDAFPHAIVNLDYGSVGATRNFLRGSNVYSRLFDFGYGDASLIWEGVIGSAIPPVTYVMMFAAKRTSLATIAEGVAPAETSEAFEMKALEFVDILLQVWEESTMTLVTKDPRLISELDQTVVSRMHEDPVVSKSLPETGSAPDGK